MAHLMTWQERLVTLRDLGHHDLALYTGLAVYEAAAAASGASQRNGRPAAGAGPVSTDSPPHMHADGYGADVSAVSYALVSLLKGFLDAALTACSAVDDEVRVRKLCIAVQAVCFSKGTGCLNVAAVAG